MVTALEERKERLKKMILQSLLLDKRDYQRVCDLLAPMSDSKLAKVEELFEQAQAKKRAILTTVASSNIEAFGKGLMAISKKIKANVQVQGIASLGRDVLKKSLKNKNAK